jgi:hypothetical protein
VKYFVDNDGLPNNVTGRSKHLKIARRAAQHKDIIEYLTDLLKN